MDGLHWRGARFDALTVTELDRIFGARQTVFAVEQRGAYLDADGADETAWHLAAWRAGERLPLAYARLVDPGVKFAEPSIGRVITLGAGRGIGLGRELVRRMVQASDAAWPGRGIRISAQAHLARFYGAFGFVAVGGEYIEDGIPHVQMLRR